MHYKYKSKPFAHQEKALKCHGKRVFAYFMEMGTGKSKVLIDNIAMLYNQGRINGALIVAPKGVYKNWYDLKYQTICLITYLKKWVFGELIQMQKT